MLIWEVIMTIDKKHDLTNPAFYPRWYHDLFRSPGEVRVEADRITANVADAPKPLGLLPFTSAWQEPNDDLWCPMVRLVWEQSIRSLRYAARMVRNAKTRQPGIGTRAAWVIWRSYVGRPRLEIRFDKSKHTFDRYQLVATPGSIFADDTGLWSQLDTRQRELMTSIDALYQNAFGSLVDGIPSPHFCEDCKRELPSTTRMGRTSRATVCQPCSMKRWKAELGTDGVRAQWRKNKQAERDKAKPRTKPN